ncbi:MAG TPA: sugar phosphate isomerase/epimerase [Opitutales bacterium]|nr:sugar phosphate isomerase/epimerase [Opitutales bacterium]
MKPTVALSTCWCSGRHQDGYEMLREMADLGFEYVELSHGIRITLVPGILKAVEEGIIKVSSTHNFCPLPAGIDRPAPNLYSPSSPDPREHQQWLRHTRRSLEFSRQVGARVMVTHMGNVRFFWTRPGSKLKEYLRKNPDTDVWGEPFQKLARKTIEKIRKKMPPFWDQLQMSIEEIVSDAERCNVIIGAENREGCEELPLDADFPEFFRQARDHKSVAWWHDVGHARIKEQLGLLKHWEFLEENHGKLAGFHLHDVSEEGNDHLALGTGTVDFEMISEYFRPEHILVLELHPRVPVEGVVESRDYLEKLLARRGLAEG